MQEQGQGISTMKLSKVSMAGIAMNVIAYLGMIVTVLLSRPVLPVTVWIFGVGLLMAIAGNKNLGAGTGIRKR